MNKRLEIKIKHVVSLIQIKDATTTTNDANAAEPTPTESDATEPNANAASSITTTATLYSTTGIVGIIVALLLKGTVKTLRNKYLKPSY